MSETHLIKVDGQAWCGVVFDATTRASVVPKEAKCYECLRAAWEARETFEDPKPIEDRMLWFVCTGE